jgi:hypothetical protein
MLSIDMGRKPSKVDFEQPINKIKPKLYKYLKTISQKVDGRSYQKILNTFTHTHDRTVLKQYYDSIKAQLEDNQDKKAKLNFKDIESKRKEVKQLQKNKEVKTKYYVVSVLFYSEGQTYDGQKPYKYKGKDYYIMFHHEKIRQLGVQGPDPFPDLLNRFVRRPGSYYTNRRVSPKTLQVRKEEDQLWEQGMTMFATDSDFAHYAYELEMEHYIGAFKIISVETTGEPKNEYKMYDKKLQDSSQVSISNKYIETVLDTSFATFKEALVKKHYIGNECWLNTIADVYSSTLLAKNKRNKVTRETILEIIGKTEEDIKEGVSINEIVPFFEKYNLQLRVFDDFMKPVFTYDPPKRDHNFKSVFCMVKNGHVYTLNDNLKELQQKNNPDEFDLKVSSTFYIREDKTVPIFRMIDNIDDIVKIVKEMSDITTKTEVKLVHKQNNLTELLYNLKEVGYEPAIKYQAGHITRLIVDIKPIRFCIESQGLAQDSFDGDVCVDTEVVYNRMNQAMCSFYQNLFKPEYLSHYSTNDIEILNKYRTTVPIGILNKTIAKDVVEIDVSRAFTSAFLQIKQVPVFNEFDYFRPYDNHEIQEHYLYIVKVSDVSLMFNKTFNLCYGMFLKDLDVDIIAFKPPSFMKDVDSKSLIDALYSEEISPNPHEDKQIKKLIANVNFGLLEKSTNKSQYSKIYNTLEEAIYYQKQYGGNIRILSKFKEVVSVSDLDAGLDIQSSNWNWVQHGQKYYILNIQKEAILKNGFRYIKEMILQHHNFKMFNCYKTLVSNGVDVFSVKSDALTIKESDIDKVKSLISFDCGLGSWRVDKKAKINFPKDKFILKVNNEIKVEVQTFNCLTLQLNDEVTIKVPTFQRIEIQDEYDTNEICEIFEKYKRVVVRADMPGCGKSYACEKMRERGHNVLFVCPTNKLVQNYKSFGVTTNKFFSIGVDFNDFVSKFDSSEYDVIVFDEIYMSCILKLRKIKQYCDSNPDKIIIATGDTLQLEPIEKLSNTIQYDEYADHCVNSIFNHEVYLMIPKRVKTEEDKQKLKNIKRDIFDANIPVMDTLVKYFKFTKEASLKNIAYTNETCKEQSELIRKRLNKTDEYEVGEILTCRKWFKSNKETFNVNFQYKIQSIVEDNITLIDESTDKTYTLTRNVIKSNFIFSYCGTCHSYQGSSIDEEMTIFDYKHYFVDRRWLWTAITRATDLNKVMFYEYEEEEETMKKVKKYFQKKVDRYKAQDKQAKRPISKDYINVDWLMKCVGVPCSHCQCCLECNFDADVVNSNISAQRVDNKLDHCLSNIIPMCVKCNCTLR